MGQSAPDHSSFLQNLTFVGINIPCHFPNFLVHADVCARLTLSLLAFADSDEGTAMTQKFFSGARIRWRVHIKGNPQPLYTSLRVQ